MIKKKKYVWYYIDNCDCLFCRASKEVEMLTNP